MIESESGFFPTGSRSGQNGPDSTGSATLVYKVAQNTGKHIDCLKMLLIRNQDPFDPLHLT